MPTNTTSAQHLAATSPNLSILHHFLLQGGSVHLRNHSGRTPLFLAAKAGLKEHVSMLRKSGAHLHADERVSAEMYAKQGQDVEIWKLAGVDIDGGNEEGVTVNGHKEA